MMFDENQFERQKAYETALYYLDIMYSRGLVTKKEHRQESRNLERKYKPIVVHIPLLNKE